MESSAGNHWLKGIGLIAAVMLFVGMGSFSPADPTITNLLTPRGGISNLAGVAGALLSGSLVELLGGSALLVPLLLLNFLFTPRHRRSAGRHLILGTAMLMISATLHGLTAPEMGLGLATAGLAGLAGARWVHSTTGIWPGAALLAPALAYCLWRLAYLPFAGAAARDMGTFSRFFYRRGRARMKKLGRYSSGRAAEIGETSRKIGRDGIESWYSLGSKLSRLGRNLLAGKEKSSHKKPPLKIRDRGEGRDPAMAALMGKKATSTRPRQRAEQGRKGGFNAWVAALDEANPEENSKSKNSRGEIQ